MNVPSNVIWFEALLYMSLTLDALSLAFQDRTPSGDLTPQVITAGTVIAGGMILLLVYLVWLAAQRRKNWPRWVLLGALVLSIYSLIDTIGDVGLQFDSAIEISWTGDAKGWFNG
jgi:uncharacterized BrkB/YihY/UPF0761 family membrane protein